VVGRLKPTSGFAHLLHLALQVIMPALVFVLVRLDFVQLALLVIVLSKWRMFAVAPRFWAANVRANAIDLMVGIATVLFMSHASEASVQLGVAAIYAGWLLFIKPASGVLLVTLQAAIGQLAALSALYMVWSDGPIWGISLITGLIAFLAARHFLDTFDEPYAKMLAYVWGYFGAALAWLLAHWLLFYSFISQPTLLLSTVGYGLAGLYYLDHHERLSAGLRRQVVFIMLAIVVVILVFSDWGDKVV
jgi:hypothetical protein